MDGLYYSIRIKICLKVKKGIQMHAVKTFCRMAFGYKVIIRRKTRPTEKCKGGPVCSNQAAGVTGLWRFCRDIEPAEYLLQCFRLELCTLLRADAVGMAASKPKKSEISYLKMFSNYKGPVSLMQFNQRNRLHILPDLSSPIL
ncbi:MAG: hypothetical protein K2N87_05170 [Eubacterium sp.]|nr:hypothetical protein [Eubacterium sp.]